MYYYALTIRKTRGEKSIEDYREYIDRINCEKQIISFETEKGLHVHLMLVSKRKLYAKDVVLERRGWSIKFSRLNDPDDVGRWVIYCNKDLYKYDFIDAEADALEIPDQLIPPTTMSTLPDEKDTSEKESNSFERKYPRFDIRKVASSYVREYLDESKRI